VLWYKRHARLSRFFFDMVGLTISAVKSEAMVFSRKHHKLDVTLWIDGRRLPQAKEFKYLGIFFDSGLCCSTQVRYVQRLCLQRLNFIRSIAGTWWRGTFEMYATIIQGTGGINSGLCVCMLLWHS
jgi:hypothetical protein